MSKYLLVYNICEIGKTNLQWYITCIDNLLKIKYRKYHILISGCRVTKDTKTELYNRYKGKVSFYYTEHYLPVNITFNKAVIDAVSRYGEFDGYIYIDSGVDIEDKYNILNEIEKRFSTNKYGMISVQTDDDNGHYWFLNREQFLRDPYIRKEDFIVPLGKCVHLHFQCFHNNLLKAFGRLLPDIFIAYCTESVLSFLNASIDKQWVILKDIILKHDKGTDGATLSYDHTGPRGQHWNNLYGCMDIIPLLSNSLTKEVGFGYEEINQILMHDDSKFTSEGFAKDKKLLEFVKDNLYLTNEHLDYRFIFDNFFDITQPVKITESY
jgi:hypothetical protein